MSEATDRLTRTIDIRSAMPTLRTAVPDLFRSRAGRGNLKVGIVALSENGPWSLSSAPWGSD